MAQIMHRLPLAWRVRVIEYVPVTMLIISAAIDPDGLPVDWLRVLAVRYPVPTHSCVDSVGVLKLKAVLRVLKTSSDEELKCAFYMALRHAKIAISHPVVLFRTAATDFEALVVTHVLLGEHGRAVVAQQCLDSVFRFPTTALYLLQLKTIAMGQPRHVWPSNVWKQCTPAWLRLTHAFVLRRGPRYLTRVAYPCINCSPKWCGACLTLQELVLVHCPLFARSYGQPMRRSLNYPQFARDVESNNREA
jgi:hypothetical protein